MAGSTNVLDLIGVGGDSIDSEGNDTIIAGDGDQAADINGDATVTGGAGSDDWSVNGTASINTGPGSAFMTLGASGTVAITGTNDFFELNSNGGSATWNTTNAGVAVAGSVVGGALSMQVYNGVMHISTSGGAVGAMLHLDQGDASVTSLGADTIYAGAGNDTVIISGGANVYAGSGSLSVFGRDDGVGANVYGAGGDTLIDGDTGNITYHGGAQASTVEAHLSNITLIGGAGLLTINGGSRDTITGGAGGIVLNDFAGGANVITTAAGSTNVLDIANIDQVNSNGDDTIVSAGGNHTRRTGDTTATTLEDGNTIDDFYGTDTVITQAGYQRFTAHAGADVTLSSENLDVLQEQDATVHVSFTDPGSDNAVSSLSAAGGDATVATNPGGGISVSTDGSDPVTINAAGQIGISSAGGDAIPSWRWIGERDLDRRRRRGLATSGRAHIAGRYLVTPTSFTLHGGAGSISVAQSMSG